MASTLLRNNKTVHFDTALNWEDEDQRTAQGVEVWRIRKQRKKERKMIQNQVKTRTFQTYSILQQTGTIEQIQDVCRNDVFCNNLSWFLTEAGANEATWDLQLRAFRNHNRGFRLRDLNENGMEYLKILAAHSVFTDEFFARSIVSSSDNDSFGERYMQDQQDLMAGDNDDPQDAAVAGNAAAP
jgi:hypothetical protein